MIHASGNFFPMLRFVTLSSSYAYHPSSVTTWKSVCYDPALPSHSRSKRNAFHLFRGDGFSWSCCLDGGYCLKRIPKAFVSVDAIRSRGFSGRSLGNRQGGPDPDHHERQRGYQRSLQVADSVRDCASDTWWTNGDETDAVSLEAEGNSIVSTELWTSQIIIQLSLFWNLLGYSPAKFEEWLATLETRRRLKLNNKRFADLARGSHPSSVANNPLQELFAGESLRTLQQKLLSAGISQFPSAPGFRALDRLSMGPNVFRNLGFVQWLSHMTNTYGTSFMILVALGYATQGFRCFPWFAVGYMLKDVLQVDPGMMQFLLSSAALPMVAKPIYGILSDTIYIRGAHRVPYLVIAGILQIISWGALALWPKATSSALILTVALTLGNVGAAIADVMNDALVAEVGKKQKGNGKGELQSFAWLIMASGGLLGNLLGGFALKQFSMTAMYFVFLILIVLHLLTSLFVNERSFDLAPPLYNVAAETTKSEKFGMDAKSVGLEDFKLHKRKRQGGRGADGTAVKLEGSSPGLYSQLRDQVALLAQLLKKKEISSTLLWFCASYAVVPVMGSSIFFYQTQVLQIDPTFIGFSRVVGQVGLMVGSQLYNGSLKGLPLRKLLGCVQFLLSFCMLSDLLLVNRVNVRLGIPDEFFVLGASALVDCISQFKVLPVVVRLAQLCPPGSEGSLMAFFSSCHCLAGLCSGYFGVALARSLRISALSFEGLPLGIFIQAMFALLPLLFITVVPSGEASKTEKIPEKVQ